MAVSCEGISLIVSEGNADCDIDGPLVGIDDGSMDGR